MSVSITFTIAGEDAAKLKDKVKEEATKEGVSMSEWLVGAVVDRLRKDNGA